MSGFRHKWMNTNTVCTDLEETEKDFVFRISKGLVAHEPFDAKHWRVMRIGKNELRLIGSQHFPRD